VAAAALLGACVTAPTAHAVGILFALDEFTGTNATANITVTNAAPTMPDVTTNLLFTVQVTDPVFADIRAIWFNVANNAILASLSATGGGVTNFGTTCAGGDTNMNPRGFEFCVEIGSSGIGGGDDFHTTSFTLTSSSGALDALTFFDFNDTDGAVGLRITSVGSAANSRGGSSKLADTYTTILSDETGGPIPEPSTIAAFGVGLLGLAWAARRRRHGFARA
jgi:hypothetical protein